MRKWRLKGKTADRDRAELRFSFSVLPYIAALFLTLKGGCCGCSELTSCQPQVKLGVYQVYLVAAG